MRRLARLMGIIFSENPSNERRWGEAFAMRRLFGGLSLRFCPSLRTMMAARDREPQRSFLVVLG